MDKQADLRELINRYLKDEVMDHKISVIPPNEIGGERIYLILNVNREHHSDTEILRIEEEKRLYFFGPAKLPFKVADLIHELRKHGYRAGNLPGGR